MISDENILKFQALYKKRFGKDISKEIAYEKGMKIIALIAKIYKPSKAA